MKSINFYSFAANIAADIDSKYINTSEQRHKLREYLTVNEWFGFDFTAKNNAELFIMEDEANQIRPRLTLWLSALGQSNTRKTQLLLEYFKAQFPHFCRLFSEFISNRNTDNTYAYWHLLNYVFSEMTKDLSEYSEIEVESFVARLSEEAPLNSAITFGDFLNWLSKRGERSDSWQYRFHRREQPSVTHSAYTMKQFKTVAYFVFNEIAWEKQNLVVKAVGNRLYADLWVFTAFNVFCALRVGDLKRLPAPSLPIECSKIHSIALSGKFPHTVALAVTRDLESRVRLLAPRPSKTKQYSNVPALRLFVPESLREPLGMIIAIALAHRPEIKPGDSFIVPRGNHTQTEEFYGSEFTAVVGRFVPRRCNKAYLQGIETIGGADNSPGKPKGYMLAALARSHKGGYATIGETTDIYLEDALFSGYTPEFIAKEMFERGVFSFIPAVLLEMYAGKQYRQLPVSAQTSLIVSLGLTPKNIEDIAAIAELSLARSRETVKHVLSSVESIPVSVFNILQNIASGNAPSRQDEYLCLMTSAGFTCPKPERGCCLGCGYEIYTKSAMHTLMREYTRMNTLRATANDGERMRYSKMLETAIFPAITEIIAVTRTLYPNNDNNELLTIVEKGLENVNEIIRIRDQGCFKGTHSDN